MARPIELIPLLCLNCATRLPANPDEAAWVCPQCGEGQRLDEREGLARLEVHYSSGIPLNQPGKPYWVVDGQARFQRKTYSGSQSAEAEKFWGDSRRFFIPAYTLPLETLLKVGSAFVSHPPTLEAGPPAPFEAVTLSLEDVTAIAQFIAMAIEADRPDKLKELQVNLQLGDPVLWILP